MTPPSSSRRSPSRSATPRQSPSDAVTVNCQPTVPPNGPRGTSGDTPPLHGTPNARRANTGYGQPRLAHNRRPVRSDADLAPLNRIPLNVRPTPDPQLCANHRPRDRHTGPADSVDVKLLQPCDHNIRAVNRWRAVRHVPFESATVGGVVERFDGVHPASTMHWTSVAAASAAPAVSWRGEQPAIPAAYPHSSDQEPGVIVTSWKPPLIGPERRQRRRPQLDVRRVRGAPCWSARYRTPRCRSHSFGFDTTFPVSFTNARVLLGERPVRELSGHLREDVTHMRRRVRHRARRAVTRLVGDLRKISSATPFVADELNPGAAQPIVLVFHAATVESPGHQRPADDERPGTRSPTGTVPVRGSNT